MDYNSLQLINERLGVVGRSTAVFNCSPNQDLVSTALSFDISKLGQADGATISQFAVVLSQYCIYMQSQYNSVYVRFINARKLFEFQTQRFMIDNKDIVKVGKTAGEREFLALNASADLQALKHDVDMLEAERDLLQDLDKSLKLLIEAYKKELGRRYDEIILSRGRGN